MSVRKFFEMNKERFPSVWEKLKPEEVVSETKPVEKSVEQPASVDEVVNDTVETKPIEKMTKNELRAFILSEFGVEADEKMNKNQLISHISDLKQPISDIVGENNKE